MTERNNFVDVVDGDQLNQGFFNEISSYYKEITEDGGSVFTTTSASPTLQRTFTFTTSGSATPEYLVIKDLEIGCTGQNINLMATLDDGTTTYAPKRSKDLSDARSFGWQTGAADNDNVILAKNNGSATADRFVFPTGLIDFTGSTTWNVKMYIATSSGATGTLVNGFTVGLVFRRRLSSFNSGTATQA